MANIGVPIKEGVSQAFWIVFLNSLKVFQNSHLYAVEKTSISTFA